MEALAKELALAMGSGPNSSLRAEVRSQFPHLLSLTIHLDLIDIPYKVVASTPDILAQTVDQTWQLHLTQADDRGGWELVPSEASQHVDRHNGAASMPILLQRPSSTPGEVQYMIKLTHQEARGPSAGRHVGALIATAAEHANTASLQRPLLQLAAALSLQSRILLDFNSSVGSALFGPPHTPSEGSEEEEPSQDDFLNDQLTTILEEPQRPNDTRDTSSSETSSGVIPSLFNRLPSFFSLWSLPPVELVPPVSMSVGLSFLNPHHETNFQYWHARQMWKFDLAALLLCITLQTAMVFTNVTQYQLMERLAVWQWAIGYCHLLVALMLLFKRSREWFIRHRNEVLLCLLAVMLVYHHSIVKNYKEIGPPLLLNCSKVAYGFIWIPYVTLLFQASFKYLAPLTVLNTAINLTHLKDLCPGCKDDSTEMSMRRCMGRGVSKVVIMVIAALCTVYCIEWRARRVYAAMRAASEA